MIDRLKARLNTWVNAGLYRKQHRVHGPMGTSINNRGEKQRVFCSNDYLGLANHPAMRNRLAMTAESHGVGTGASRLVVGHTNWHEQAERAFADFFGFDQALLFSSGYAANVGVIQALTARGDVIHQDRLNHASLIDGARLSDGQLKRFPHLDYTVLNTQLEKASRIPRLIVSDAVFSMRGDQADLSALVQIKQQHAAALMIDDAHGVGVLGQHGRGALDEHSVSPSNIDVYVCPLGKAFGVFGAMVMGSDAVIDALRQFARSYMYSTAIPSVAAACACEALQIMQTETWRHDTLRSNIAYFKSLAQKKGWPFLESDTAIQALPVGDAKTATALSHYLLTQGFLVTAIRTPTVPAGSEQLRFTLTATHTEQDISELFDAIEQSGSMAALRAGACYV